MKAVNVLMGFALIAVVAVAGCTTAAQHRSELGSTQDANLTVGVVQKEIRKGMSGAEVTMALGSPNLVTKDESEKEVWVYDKIATEASYSESQSAFFFIIGGYSQNAGAASVTQRTLTVVVKFNKEGRVETCTYHSSKF